ncbi:hypothetical protein TNCT_527871 [Trichonephila clavata]|uniref:Uncharacterized protein n=1 Tax=Trichonephila clavata TaxID=2740835 RepID=A0A8X6GNZ7_TRICU|nr:hypothetical protein TNCT_527871 [Trichonephila clavata]
MIDDSRQHDPNTFHPPPFSLENLYTAPKRGTAWGVPRAGINKRLPEVNREGSQHPDFPHRPSRQRFYTPRSPESSFRESHFSQLHLNEEDWPKDNGTDSPNGCTDSEECFCLSIDELLSPKIRHRGRGRGLKAKTLQKTCVIALWRRFFFLFLLLVAHYEQILFVKVHQYFRNLRI